jgi:hypothetical protein
VVQDGESPRYGVDPAVVPLTEATVDSSAARGYVFRVLGLKRLPIVAVLAALAFGLASPALCAGDRHEAMPCCQADRDCGASLGRPSCCLDAPGETDRSAAGAQHKGTRNFDAPAPRPSDLAGDVMAAPGGTRLEPRATAPDPPPLFLLHVSFLC